MYRVFYQKNNLTHGPIIGGQVIAGCKLFSNSSKPNINLSRELFLFFGINKTETSTNNKVFRPLPDSDREIRPLPSSSRNTSHLCVSF